MKTEEPYIRVDNITQQFGEQQVLRGVSFEVKRGEMLALIGGSGAGKSVILKHVAGLMDPLTGHVYIDGEEISNIPERKKFRLRAKLGVMFQGGALFDSMTVEDNVAFPLIEEGKWTNREIQEKVDVVLDSVGLAGHNLKMPANLSGGMIKRVAIARAMVTMPECLLYDEPTAGLDPIVTDSVSYLMRRICVDDNKTSIIVTHDMTSVMQVADRIIYLRNGTMYWTGTPKEMKESQDQVLQDFLQGNAHEDWTRLHAQKQEFTN